jgi:DNA sulfur modification protein DndC
MSKNVKELIDHINYLNEEIQMLYSSDYVPWVIGYSGGKDSSCTLQLVWNAIAALPVEQRHKSIYVISTDTRVENPIVSQWVKQSLNKLNQEAEKQQLPIQANLLQPIIKETFWVNLIGKGYPAPRNKFRWCTERLKIHPANRFIRDTVREHGETILVLGTRKAESAKRASTMEKHAQRRVRDRLSPNASLPNSLIYTPIEDWSNDDVWLYLMQYQNPWENSNDDLFQLYRGATADNECPLVVDTSTPSCGDSRFGCWVCTMVDQDKSMAAMILNDDDKAWMEPLLDIRNELDVDDDRNRRDFRRIWGSVQIFERRREDGTTEPAPIPGPYTKQWREHWLRRVLTAQKELRQTAPESMRNITLISLEELHAIRQIWLEEKHEFDDSLPRIYQETTGEIFPLPVGESSLLGSEEWDLLTEICQDDFMHLELMASLLDTERQYRTMSKRIGIFDALDKCFQRSSLTEVEAIAKAQQQYQINQALKQYNAADLKKHLHSEKPEFSQQLNLTQVKSQVSISDSTQDWAAMKFGGRKPE